MLATIVFGAIETGLIYSLVGLGVFIAFRLLNFPDLTADGCFPLGGALCGFCLYMGMNPWLSTLLALLAGALAGSITAFLYIRLRVMPFLSGIIMMVALYSVNFRILTLGPVLKQEILGFNDSDSLSLLVNKTLFSRFIARDFNDQYLMQPLIIFGFVILSWFLLNQFFLTQKGLALRATGSNPAMANAQGIPTGRLTIIGMAIANGLIALAGALFVQTQGRAEISSGIGTLIMGLSAIIIGEAIFPTKRIALMTLSVIVGSILYRFVIAMTFENHSIRPFGFNAKDLNFVTALVVIFAIVLPHKIRKWLYIIRGSQYD